MPYVYAAAAGNCAVCSIGDELYVGSHATSIKEVISAAAFEDPISGYSYVAVISLSKSVQVLRSENKGEWTLIAKQYVEHSFDDTCQ